MVATFPKLDQDVASGPGSVEIAGFPQILHTRSFGHPDMLFLPLLGVAREAADLCERLATSGESREHAATMGGIQLVSGLLKDSNFSLSARGMQDEHFYFVDLAAGTLSVQTRVYAEVSRRTSMFKVEFTGKIREGIYAMRIGGDSSATLQFDDEQVRQPMFFSNFLAQQCLHLQAQRDQTRRTATTGGEKDTAEVHLAVSLANKKIPIILKKNEAAEGWEVLDGQLRARLAMLSPDAENHLRLLFAALSSMLAGEVGTSHPAAAPSPSLVGAAKNSSRP